MDAVAENANKYFQLPKPLYDKADEISKRIGLNLNELLKMALENFVVHIEKDGINKEIADACKVYYKIDKKIASEWRSAEGKI